MQNHKITEHYNQNGQLDSKTKEFKELPFDIMVEMNTQNNEKWDISAFNFKKNPNNEIIKYKSTCGKKGLSFTEANTIFESVNYVKDIPTKICGKIVITEK